MKLRVYIAGLLAAWVLMSPERALAQVDSTLLSKVQAARKKKEVVVPLTFKERLAFKVNMVDWALMVANVGMEFDLSASPYNRYTMGANVRYAGGAHVPYNPRCDWKLFDAQLELRRYWHPSLTMKPGQKRKPKYWRAYYWGAYAAYSDYTVYMPNGYKGSGLSIGGSFGWEVALLSFKHGALDLDLGLSAGFQYGKYDKSRMEYGERVLVKEQDWKFIPYPLPHEIRVGLVYRFKTVREKFVKKKH